MGRDCNMLLCGHGWYLTFDIYKYVQAGTIVQAKNIVNYLRIIHKILAPGGVWINLGL